MRVTLLTIHIIAGTVGIITGFIALWRVRFRKSLRGIIRVRSASRETPALF